MLQRLAHFIQYHNAIPIFFGVIFLGSGVALAANDDVRRAVVSSEQVVRSIDNTRIANVNLDTYSVGVEITDVTEDDEFYYVAYRLYTIELVDSVWQDVQKEQTLRVAKTAIEGRDLGTHATRELAQVRDNELRRLRETQEIERARGISTKSVATVYSGLVGRYLDEREEKLEGYQPVVEEQPAAPYPDHIAQNPQPVPRSDEQQQSTIPSEGSGDGSTTVGDPTDTEPPTISILGNNPARVALHATYLDLGAYVHDNVLGDISYTTVLDGEEVDHVSIDTSTTSTYTVTYRAHDQVGNTAQASRTIIVYDPSAEDAQVSAGGGDSSAATSTSTDTQATTTPETTDEPSVPMSANATTTPSEENQADSHESGGTSAPTTPEQGSDTDVSGAGDVATSTPAETATTESATGSEQEDTTPPSEEGTDATAISTATTTAAE